ncbi:uncharacterized protein LOC115948619 [Geospiza fortis]|uniref:Uncharacterized protein LOC115948619 n=1 Tax=Geospiza fortis TaxID=48883 RepID=A0A8N5EVB6_GEOFO|nr:uncharacterized protein LOC115948619 [Geospiza fortis]
MCALLCARVWNCTLGCEWVCHSSVLVSVHRLCRRERGPVWDMRVLMCMTLHTLVCTALYACVGVHMLVYMHWCARVGVHRLCVHMLVYMHWCARVGVHRLCVQAGLVLVGTCALPQAVHRCVHSVCVAHMCWCVQAGRAQLCVCVCVCAGVCCWQVPLCTGSARVPVCTQGPGTWLWTQLWIHSSVRPAAVPPGETDSLCVCVCVCVSVCVSLLSSAGWRGPRLSVYTQFSWPNRRPRTGRVCPLSCPHPHRVVTIPRGCRWCCRCCPCRHHAPEPPQLSPPLPARCRLASVAEMVRAQPRAREQPGPAAIAPGQWWAVTRDSAGL